MEQKKLTKEDSIRLLREKYDLLCRTESGRYPKRSDFSDREVVAIKAFLGPWPRALEEAGIKMPREDDHREKNRKKRIRARRAAIAARKEAEKKNVNKANQIK